MVKRLTLKDQLTREEYLERVQQYTDEDAHRLGYSSAEVLRLEIRLGELAGEWRETKDDRVASRYRETLLTMILKGYDIDTLPVQDQLPEEYMPDFPPQPVRKAIIEAYEGMASVSSL
jgi:hypothetical protein